VISQHHTVSPKEKINIFFNVELPSAPLKLRSFPGMKNFMSKYLVGILGEIATLNNLFKMAEKKLIWDEESTKAFNNLKCKVSKSETLHIADYTKLIIILCDASIEGVGGVVCQTKGKSIPNDTKQHNIHN
jgi:RNase H-like domain found in reverse transcriptase